jgi:hypothetical protein
MGGTTVLALAGCTSDPSNEGGTDGDPASAGTDEGTEAPRSATRSRSSTGNSESDVRGTDSEADAPPDTAEPTPQYAGAISLDALQPSLLYLETDAIGVGGGPGQFLYLDVSIADSVPPAKGNFAFEFGGDSYDPVFETRGLWRAYDRDAEYDATTGEGWLLFELPATGEADDARLTWGNEENGQGEWRPDQSLRERLASFLPKLSVSVSVPEVVSQGDDPTISVTATNEGDLPTRLVGGLNRSGPSVAVTPVTPVSKLVPAGESVTWKHADSSVMYRDSGEDGDDDPDMTYRLRTPYGDFVREVRITD